MNHCILPPLLGNLFTLINQHRNSFGGPLGFASQEQQLSNFFLLPVIKKKKKKTVHWGRIYFVAYMKKICKLIRASNCLAWSTLIFLCTGAETTTWLTYFGPTINFRKLIYFSRNP